MEALPLKERPDVRAILDMSDDDFKQWYLQRKGAIHRCLNDYELFAGIPHLGYEKAQHTMGAITHVKDHVESLKRGLRYLEALKKHRDIRRVQTA